MDVVDKNLELMLEGRELGGELRERALDSTIRDNNLARINFLYDNSGKIERFPISSDLDSCFYRGLLSIAPTAERGGFGEIRSYELDETASKETNEIIKKTIHEYNSKIKEPV